MQSPKITGQFAKLGLSEQRCKWELACDIQGLLMAFRTGGSLGKERRYSKHLAADG